MLKWLSINKVAMIALAALVSPLIAILGGLVSSVVSYRAVVTGPRIQREIADRQIRLTSSQMTASLFGAAVHKWIDDFRETFSLLLSLINERGSIIAVVRHQEGKPLPLARQLDQSESPRSHGQSQFNGGTIR
jgi:hypothetical protein